MKFIIMLFIFLKLSIVDGQLWAESKSLMDFDVTDREIRTEDFDYPNLDDFVLTPPPRSGNGKYKYYDGLDDTIFKLKRAIREDRHRLRQLENQVETLESP